MVSDSSSLEDIREDIEEDIEEGRTGRERVTRRARTDLLDGR